MDHAFASERIEVRREHIGPGFNCKTLAFPVCGCCGAAVNLERVYSKKEKAFFVDRVVRTCPCHDPETKWCDGCGRCVGHDHCHERRKIPRIIKAA